MTRRCFLEGIALNFSVGVDPYVFIDLVSDPLQFYEKDMQTFGKKFAPSASDDDKKEFINEAFLEYGKLYDVFSASIDKSKDPFEMIGF